MFNKLATLYSNWRSRLHVQFQPQCPSRVFPEFEKDTSPYKKKKNKKYHQLVRFNPVLSRPSPGGWFGSPWVFVLSAIIALSAIQVSFPRGHFRADSADWHGEKNCDSKGHTKVVSISFPRGFQRFMVMCEKMTRRGGQLALLSLGNQVDTWRTQAPVNRSSRPLLKRSTLEVAAGR